MDLSGTTRLKLRNARAGLNRNNIIGRRIFYNVDSGPIDVLDQRTLKVPRFTFDAHIPPGKPF